jgi:superfamily II DNA/RNA helicase
MSPSTAAPVGSSFADLGVNPHLVEALRLRQILEPFAIQSLVVPDGVAGRDLLGRAPTGSGKTLAFGIPALHRLAELEPSTKKRPRALILSPTRELAEQIAQELEPLAHHLGRQVLAVYGGVPILRHIKALSKGVDLLVACPGRLLDLVDQRAVRLDEVEIAVVDEADRMADMGFLPDVKKLLDMTASERRQTLLFSATLDDEVRVLVDRYQQDPVVHEIGEPEPDLSLMTHRFIRVPKKERIWVAADLIAESGPTVVFVRTRHGVDRVARQLRQEGISSGHIHGGRSQAQRDRALQVFIEGKVQALVATDVAARGIHVDGVAAVLHYDPPADHKDYVHRSGRTARAGASGVVISLLDKPQVNESLKMQEVLGIDADIEAIPAKANRDRTPVVTGSDRQRQRSTRPKADGAHSSRDRKPSRSGGPAKKSTNNTKNTAKKTAKKSAKKAAPKTTKRSSNRADDTTENKTGTTTGNRAGKAGNRSGTRAAGPAKKAAKKSTKRTAKKAAGSRRPNERGSTQDSSEQSRSGKPKRNARKAAAKASKRSGKSRPRNRKNKSNYRSSTS